MLHDQYNRRFNYLRLSVTEVCNFKCNYCLPDGFECQSKPSQLSLGELETVAKAFAEVGTTKIRLTGGEPTLRKDLSDIIALCAAQDNIKTVGLTTNAYRLPSQLQGFVDAGLSALNISADSLNPNTFLQITGSDKLHQVLRSVDDALVMGIKKVKLNAVLLKQYNARELQYFLDFIKDKPVTFRFIELMETGDNRDYFAAQHVSGERLKQQLMQNGWQILPKAADAGPALELCHPDYQGQIGLIMPYSKDFCASCNRLRVSTQGKLHMCLFGENGDDLRPWLESGDVEGLKTFLLQSVQGKTAGHQLQHHITGSTKHLAMLGG